MNGGLITAVIGVISFPWQLYEDVGAYIFTWLVGYGSLLASFLAVMVFDDWLLRRTRLNVEELYRYGEGGEYWFSSGFNWRALAAVAAGVIPVLPGFLNAATTEGGVVADPELPRPALSLRRLRGLRHLGVATSRSRGSRRPSCPGGDEPAPESAPGEPAHVDTADEQRAGDESLVGDHEAPAVGPEADRHRRRDAGAAAEGPRARPAAPVP